MSSMISGPVKFSSVSGRLTHLPYLRLHAAYLFLLAMLQLCIPVPLLSQHEIPIGTWRAHLSYQAIHAIAEGTDKIYGAAHSGVVLVDKEDKSITTYSKLNGLSRAGITAMDFDPASGQLLIGYEDGTFDAVANDIVHSFDPAQDASISGSRRINQIFIKDHLAYLATAYGVVIFDLQRGSVKETWRDLGAEGNTLEIISGTFKEDSIFLATGEGVMAGDLSDNLLDFNQWKRFNSGVFDNKISSIAEFKERIYTIVPEVGLMCYDQGQWSQPDFLTRITPASVHQAEQYLYVIENTAVWRIDDIGLASQVNYDAGQRPSTVKTLRDGSVWIGDMNLGMVNSLNGNYAYYKPNGPGTHTTFRLKYLNDRMYFIPGGYDKDLAQLNLPGIVDVFSNGLWNKDFENSTDITDADVANGSAFYFSSFGDGLFVRDASGNITHFDDTNSPLTSTKSPPERSVEVPAIERATDGLWVTNYGAVSPLHLLKDDNTWQSFSFPVGASRFPTDIVIDLYGYVWMVLNPDEGGGLLVVNPADGKYNYLTAQDNSGGLPSNAARCVAVDRDGYVWVGTDQGVAYLSDPSNAALKPIYENRFLLRDDKVTAIEVDGGNRKWIGTERGVWLFNATGEEMIYNFTEDNSPLLSNILLDIEINDATGEVFFSTDKGVVSYRGDATEGTSSFSDIKIFPNPVTNEFSGHVGITGLSIDAEVKITDVSGKLLWQSKANGGTVSWDVRDYTGRRAATGIYLVFAANEDGSEDIVGKIAVVD